MTSRRQDYTVFSLGLGVMESAGGLTSFDESSLTEIRSALAQRALSGWEVLTCCWEVDYFEAADPSGNPFPARSVELKGMARRSEAGRWEYDVRVVSAPGDLSVSEIDDRVLRKVEEASREGWEVVGYGSNLHRGTAELPDDGPSVSYSSSDHLIIFKRVAR